MSIILHKPPTFYIKVFLFVGLKTLGTFIEFWYITFYDFLIDLLKAILVNICLCDLYIYEFMSFTVIDVALKKYKSKE